MLIIIRPENLGSMRVKEKTMSHRGNNAKDIKPSNRFHFKLITLKSILQCLFYNSKKTNCIRFAISLLKAYCVLCDVRYFAF